MVVGLVGLYSFRSQLVGMDPSETTTSTSTFVSPGKQEQAPAGPQVCLKVGEEKYCMPLQAAQLSGMLKQMVADMPEPDEDDEDPESIIILVDQDLFKSATIEKLVASIKKLVAIKSKNPLWNNAQILEAFVESGSQLGINEINGLLLAQAADFYNVPLLWKGIARFYMPKLLKILRWIPGYSVFTPYNPIEKMVKRGVYLMGKPLFYKFAKEYYSIYWVLNPKEFYLIKPKDNPSLLEAYLHSGASIQEFIDNNVKFYVRIFQRRRWMNACQQAIWDEDDDEQLDQFFYGPHLENRGINSLEGLMNFWWIKQEIGIDLSRNELEKIPKNAFAQLPILMHLDLSDNPIKKISRSYVGLKPNVEVIGVTVIP